MTEFYDINGEDYGEAGGKHSFRQNVRGGLRVWYKNRYYVLVRILKRKWFAKFAEKAGISDTELKVMVKRLEKGLFYAHLGGGVYKEKAGKHNYRVVVLFKMGDKAFFEYGFAKADMDTIPEKRIEGFKKLAKDLFSLTDTQIAMLLADGTYTEL